MHGMGRVNTRLNASPQRFYDKVFGKTRLFSSFQKFNLLMTDVPII